MNVLGLSEVRRPEVEPEQITYGGGGRASCILDYKLQNQQCNFVGNISKKKMYDGFYVPTMQRDEEKVKIFI